MAPPRPSPGWALFFAVSALIMAAGIISTLTMCMVADIQFKGGTKNNATEPLPNDTKEGMMQ